MPCRLYLLKDVRHICRNECSIHGWLSNWKLIVLNTFDVCLWSPISFFGSRIVPGYPGRALNGLTFYPGFIKISKILLLEYHPFFFWSFCWVIVCVRSHCAWKSIVLSYRPSDTYLHLLTETAGETTIIIVYFGLGVIFFAVVAKLPHIHLHLYIKSI